MDHSGMVSSSSDVRLKENINPLEFGRSVLDIISEVGLVTFTRKPLNNQVLQLNPDKY